MPLRIVVPIVSDQDKNIAPDFAYGLYSALLRRVSPDIAERLHHGGPCLLTQHLRAVPHTPGAAEWVVNVISEVLSRPVFDALAGTQVYELPRFGCVLRAGIPQVERVSLKPQKPAWGMTLLLCSPATFRTGGRYALFPSVQLILHSAAKRAAETGLAALPSQLEMESLAVRVALTDYDLRTFRYRMKEVRVPAFWGRVRLAVRGTEDDARLFTRLLCTLPLTGLGIKTALGMGGVTVLPDTRPPHGHSPF